MSCSVGCRCGLDLALVWLCCRLVDTAPIRPLDWELSYPSGVARKSPPPPVPKKRKRNSDGHGCCEGFRCFLCSASCPSAPRHFTHQCSTSVAQVYIFSNSNFLLSAPHLHWYLRMGGSWELTQYQCCYWPGLLAFLINRNCWAQTQNSDKPLSGAPAAAGGSENN